MHIHRHETAVGDAPPEQGFVGEVSVAGYVRRAAPSRLSGASVAFAPGSRTPWKTGPLGQTLVVVSGSGRAQCEGEPLVELHPGDVVWFPPGVRHWEGAAPDEALRYVALQEAPVVFAEAVSDSEYRTGSAPHDRG